MTSNTRNSNSNEWVGAETSAGGLCERERPIRISRTITN